MLADLELVVHLQQDSSYKSVPLAEIELWFRTNELWTVIIGLLAEEVYANKT